MELGRGIVEYLRGSEIPVYRSGPNGLLDDPSIRVLRSRRV